MSLSPVAIVHFLATAAMVGVIWLVQLTHYPAFRFVDREQFHRFQSFHCATIGFVVVPLMLAEATTGILLWLYDDTRPLFVASLGLMTLIWLSTFLVQVPLHNKLEAGYDRAAIDRLVLTNWLRTVCWTGRLLLLVLPLVSR